MTAAALIAAAAIIPGVAHAAQPERAHTIRQAKQEIRRLWGAQAPTAMCIVRRESGWNPRAINWRDMHSNGRGSFGLLQIGRVHVGMVAGDWRRLLDPVVNVRVAYRLYRRAGWQPWGGGC